MTFPSLGSALVILAVATALLLEGCAPASEIPANISDRGAVPDAILIEYKLDPRLTSGVYMGERWVSPPVYDIVQPGTVFMVEARAQGMYASGQISLIDAIWEPENTHMVKVNPESGNYVSIFVRSAGETTLRVTYQGVSITLVIKAENLEDAIRVQIGQTAGSP